MTQTLQCPGCHAAVAVRDDAGGTRVQCPHCEQQLVVPGFGTSSSSDDDDWLELEAPKLADVTPPASSDAVSMPADEEPLAESQSSTETDEDSGDDDLFGMELPPMAPVTPRPAIRDDPFTSLPDELPPIDLSPPAAPVAQDVEYETEFTIKCHICGSHADVTAKQSGKQIRCRDCHTPMKVPPAPRRKTPVQIDMDSAATFTFNESSATRDDRPADPYRKSASELLAEAEKVEEESPPDDLDVPKIRDWAQSTFGILAQMGVLVHWIALSLVGAMVGSIVVSVGTPILLMSLFPLGIFFAAMVLACGFTILQSVANDEDGVTDWPLTLEPMEWLAPMVFCFAAVGLVGGPAWFLASMPFGQGLTTVFLTMASIFILFPFVLLSMLDMQNILVPFSPEVGRSITRCEEAWGSFYFSAGILFFGTFMGFAVGSLSSPVANVVIAVFLGVAATFVYFALIGRLAFAIGQSVNEVPRENDIESIRDAERRGSK
ncbi:MAG: hypothetical protein AAGC97_01390 [Planctomycetota bacterium]